MPPPRKKKRAGPVTLKIPPELFASLERLIENTGFRSVTEFAVHVLRDIAAGGQLKDQRPAGLSEHEIERVRQRLRALGYIE
jgi:hypothetical protein